jgi:hypothetical protein
MSTYAYLLYLLVICVIACVLWVLFLLNLRNLLLAVSPPNRRMSPNYVWLNFVPVFGFYWLIRTVMAVRDSARSEFQSRGWNAGGGFHYGIGLTMAVLRIAYAASYLLYVAVRGEGILGVGLLLIALIVGLASLILWIIYWAEANSLKNQLMRPLLSPMPMGNPAYLAYGAAPAGYYPPQYAGQPVYQQPPPPQWPQPQQPWQQPQAMPPQPAQWQPAPPQPMSPQLTPQWAPPQQSPSPAPTTGPTPAAGGQDAPSACGGCGSALTPDDVFCGACGKPVPR